MTCSFLRDYLSQTANHAIPGPLPTSSYNRSHRGTFRQGEVLWFFGEQSRACPSCRTEPLRFVLSHCHAWSSRRALPQQLSAPLSPQPAQGSPAALLSSAPRTRFCGSAACCLDHRLAVHDQPKPSVLSSECRLCSLATANTSQKSVRPSLLY